MFYTKKVTRLPDLTVLLVMLTTDSIDPSVKDFSPLIDSIDHRSQNPYQNDDHRSIGSYSTDGTVSIHRSKIGFSTHFSALREIIGRAKYDGLKGLCQKICCSKTVKMKKAEVNPSIKSCIMCMISLHFIPTHSL
jgi:hypothetical protein